MATSTLRGFYKNRSILVTGVTGFMGKVLVEKLLRSCPEIKNIYVLIRPKSGQNEQCRLNQLLNAKIFDLLKKEQPEAIAKLVAIGGDIGLSRLGLSPANKKLLVDNVSVIFHSAATVKFAEEFRKSVEMNARGTQRIVDLCREMPHLVALVHVSTAYCNCERKEIEEKVYPLGRDPYQVFEAMEWMDQDLVDTIGPWLLAGRPNTYTYTKALAENVLLNEQGILPVAIIRPSIVGPTWKDPMPCGKGIIRTYYCNPDMAIDIVPVDVCTNMMIAIAWHTAMYKPSEIPVYNCTSGHITRLTYGEAYGYFLEYTLKNPFNNILWYPTESFKRNKLYNDFCSFFCHFIPAYCIDVVIRMIGKKPFLVSNQRKIQKGLACLEYFGNNEWYFHNDNYWRLWEAMTEDDRCEFNFDLRQLNWSSYFEHCALGGKVYLLKEELSDLPAARSHLHKMYYLRQAVHAIGLIIFCHLLITTYQLYLKPGSASASP